MMTLLKPAASPATFAKPEQQLHNLLLLSVLRQQTIRRSTAPAQRLRYIPCEAGQQDRHSTS
jgi:hypothetical protein